MAWRTKVNHNFLYGNNGIAALSAASIYLRNVRNVRALRIITCQRRMRETLGEGASLYASRIINSEAAIIVADFLRIMCSAQKHAPASCVL